MGNSIRSAEAIVVLPTALDGSVCDKRVGAWLARGDVERSDTAEEILSRVVAAIAQPVCNDGHAALRFWGQTRNRPTAWMVAADPVHLEARLDHLRLRCLAPSEWHERELLKLFDELQTRLALDGSLDFLLVDSSGYIQAHSPMPSASFSPSVVHGCDPITVLPAGPQAARYQQLLSEIQMTLHHSEVNQHRDDRNLPAINSLWIWGGGLAAETRTRDIPALFADDAVLQGYWLSSRRKFELWPGSLDRCFEMAPDGFVAVTPPLHVSAEEYAETLTKYLRELRQLFKNSGLGSMTLIFRQGLTARIRPGQIFRAWRREIPDLATSTRT